MTDSKSVDNYGFMPAKPFVMNNRTYCLIDGISDVNKDLGLKAKAKDPKYQGQIFHLSSPYSVHHFFIVNVV